MTEAAPFRQDESQRRKWHFTLGPLTALVFSLPVDEHLDPQIWLSPLRRVDSVWVGVGVWGVWERLFIRG